jgi:putative tryptophan/tyrosine transport system substrate-binding protein
MRARRHFLRVSVALAGLGLLSGCGIPFGPAVKPARLHRIGFLSGNSATSSGSLANVAALRQGLQELGYVEGQNVAIEQRNADGLEEHYPLLAAELVRLDVDVIVTGGSAVIRAAGQATATIPIVFAATGDPVEGGLVASLARPGGNITGLTTNFGEEHLKRLELLKEAVPGLSRVAVLWNQSAVRTFSEIEMAAQQLGIRVMSLEVRSPDDLDMVLAVATPQRVDGLMAVGGPVFGFLTPRIAEFAVRHRLPSMYSNPPSIEAGGLMTYAANIPQNYRRAATYVDKIFKGAKPADLPVQQPTAYDFVINLKTAQAIGLTIPRSVLQQATQVIQ